MIQLSTEHNDMSNASDADLSPATSYEISPVPEIVAELRAGRLVILVDEEDRENEGDLVMAAEFVTPEAINFMVTHARGLVRSEENPSELQSLMRNSYGVFCLTKKKN